MKIREHFMEEFEFVYFLERRVNEVHCDIQIKLFIIRDY